MAYRIHVPALQAQFDAHADETVLDAALRAQVALPHECRFGGCGTCRVRIESGLVAYEEPPMALSEAEQAEGYALACQARPCSDLVLQTATPGLDFAEPRRMQASVQSAVLLCPDVVHLTLALPPDHGLSYLPGQYLNLVLEDGRTRSFSMASPPGADTVELHVRRIPGGRFTEHAVRDLLPGTPLTLDAPLGTFCYRERDWRPMIMVATGTGIAPIKAILESLLDNPDCPPIALYWGMRGEADLYCRTVIERWQERLYEFTFHPVLSRPDPAWTGRRGHVQDAVVADYPDLSEHALYLCGSPDMIRDAKALFSLHGASLAHVYADGFSFQREGELAVG